MLAAACWSEILAAQERPDTLEDVSGPKLVYLDQASAAEITAIAAQIIPDDETPGALAAGVIHFVDAEN